LALEDDHPEALAHGLHSVEAEARGFAFEGAAVGLALLDQLTPWRRDRLTVFLEAQGAAHVYMIHAGVGWALARLRRNVAPVIATLDAVLGWLAVDGYGFHDGYFYWPRYVTNQEVPRHLLGYARQAFDQGLGRSLWFVEGADVIRIA